MLKIRIFRRWVRKTIGVAVPLVLIGVVTGFGQDREWRTWTSADGTEIEAYLKEIQDDQVVIVRRDGREFRVPISRFSSSDREYVAAHLQEQLPSAKRFRAMDFSEVELPTQHEIPDVPHRRPQSREPVEAAAIQMVLGFHGISFGAEARERLDAMEGRRGEVMPARNVQTALGNLPVDVETIQHTPARSGQDWENTVNAIRTALSWDLPVIVARSPEFAEETLVGVATGYGRREIRVIDPLGGRSPIRFDPRDLEDSMVWALIMFPRAEEVAELPPATSRAPTREFLSKVSQAIRQAPEFEPEPLAAHFTENGVGASLRDVNREDLLNNMGQTRSFARSGGIGFIEDALDSGRLVVIPRELNPDSAGFTLIYGRSGDDFLTVDFRQDRTFEREVLGDGDIAGRWMYREDRNYHLYMIEITIPGESEEEEAPPQRANRERRYR